jgi:hypothetical protein
LRIEGATIVAVAGFFLPVSPFPFFFPSIFILALALIHNKLNQKRVDDLPDLHHQTSSFGALMMKTRKMVYGQPDQYIAFIKAFCLPWRACCSQQHLAQQKSAFLILG